VISDETHHVYSRPLISYYLAGKVKPENMVYRKKDFYEKNDVKTVLGVKATAVDAKKKTVSLDNGEIVEIGDHQALLAKRGFYHHLYMSQFKGNEI